MAGYEYRQYDYGEGRGVRFNVLATEAIAPGESLTVEGELYLPAAAAGVVVKSVVLDLVLQGSATNPWDWADYDTPDGDVYARMEYEVDQAWQADTPIPFTITVEMTQAIAQKAAALGEGRYFHADIHFAFRTDGADFNYFDTQAPAPGQCLDLLQSRVASSVGTPVWTDENPRDYLTALGGMLQRMSWPKLEVPVTVDPYGNSPVSLRCQIGSEEQILRDPEVSYDQQGNPSWKFVYRFGMFTQSGTQAVALTLTDRRGGTATASGTLEIIPYASPALTSFLPERYVTVLTEDEPEYQVSDEGVDVWMNYTGSVQAFAGSQANSWTLTLSWWPDGDETSAQSQTLESDANGRALLAQQNRQLFTTQLSASVTWKLRLTLSDWVGVRVSRLVELEKAGNLFNVEPWGVAVGMRSTADAADPNKFEVAEDWETNLRGRLVLGGCLIPSSASAGFHNCLYRGICLGSSVTPAQYAQIAAGTFDDLFIGDYWTINGVNWRIADFDYWLNTGDTPCGTHHVVIVPDTVLATCVMNPTQTTAGAYVGSNFYTGANGNAGRATARTAVINAFGATHILTHREMFANAVTNGAESGQDFYDSQIELMNECMVYGSNVFHNTMPVNTFYPAFYTMGKSQLALFRYRHDLIGIRAGWWMRDVGSGDTFAAVRDSGFSCLDFATSVNGVRPAFGLISQ